MVVLRTAAFALAAATVAVAQSSQQKCSPGSKCPADSPCCSSYGNCGTGAYCLGGCDPKSSFNLQSCMPAPVCKSGDFALNTLNDVSPNTVYLGDASKANWVSSGSPAVYQNQAMLLTMAPNTVGTLLSSTHYMWYGKVGATITTSQGQGVVTAFILMSDVKDEIDYEWVGVDLGNAQSNYYFQGITNYQNGQNLSVSNTVENSHRYEITWSPDQIDWSIDGQVRRTLKKSDTYNDTSKSYHYPQSPARVQFSLWPAGLPQNGEGTINWAGGLVDWDSPYMENGYYYAMIKDVSIDCYDAPSGSGSGSVYKYTSEAGTQDTIQLTNDNSVLASFQANGNNQQYNPNAKPSGTSTSSSGPKPTVNNDNTVPGMVGAGSFSNDAQSNSGGNVAADGSSSDSTGSSTGSSSGSSSSGTSSSSGSSGNTGSGGFSQGTTGSSGSTGEGSRVVAGSLVALVAFLGAAMMI
ncbi:concanavalin A-like lectin/glucanase domain-containing protein [Elsinoe ampelina]|uniref:Crh-like protein n=1 Tax=Elsinoe ampelina TaxID=302913 RepID=A0A6A6G7D7_9PEZI|nr:concanavalin A-like lectin/glucanase domain-containing protein [Elsinoe ampelina]